MHLFHTTRAALREQILHEGLRPNCPGGMTQAGSWAAAIYGYPLYLSQEPWNASSEYDVWEVDVQGLQLGPDLPSLVDYGMYLEGSHPEFMEAYWEMDDERGFPFHDAFGDSILVTALLQAPQLCVALTATATHSHPIGPERLKLYQAAQTEEVSYVPA